MPSYRAYRLDKARRILTAQWIEAPNDEAAKVEAKDDLCEDGVPAVELWQATRLVDEIDCEDEDAAA
jgi:hypothetical protein